MDWTCPHCYRLWPTLGEVEACMAWHQRDYLTVSTVYGYTTPEYRYGMSLVSDA